jgi:tetratricopeptide (TPR) repeat protein
MTDLPLENKTAMIEEEKSQAQQDYADGQEFLKNNDLTQAANAFHNALIGFEQENNKNGIANASDRLGDICADRGEFEKAIRHYDRAYAICSDHSDRFSMFSLERKKAKLALESRDFDLALALYLEVLDEYGALRNPQGSVETLETLAGIYLQRGDKVKAADSYRMAAKIHQNFKHAREAAKLQQLAEELEKQF